MLLMNNVSNKSFFAKLNPSFKFVAFICCVVAIFLPGGFFGQLLLLSLFIPMLIFARLTKKTYINIAKTFFIMLILFFLINWITTKNPLAVYLDDKYLIAGGAFNKNFLWTGGNYQSGVYISQIYGGEIIGKLTNDQVDAFANVAENKKLITQWMKQFDNELKTQLLDKVKQTYTGSNPEAFLYMLNNDFALNGVKYKNEFVMNSPHMLNNIAFSNEAVVIFSTKWYTVTPFTFFNALSISIKVILIIISSTILTQTTTAIELTNGLEKLLSPLKLFKIPASEFALIISIGIRFIPSLLSESKRILNAQAARGVDFYNGNLIVKIKAIIALVVPLFSISIRKSDELANAMDARGYVPQEPRTVYRVLKSCVFDYLYLTLIVFVLVLILCLFIFNFVFAPFGIVDLRW